MLFRSDLVTQRGVLALQRLRFLRRIRYQIVPRGAHHRAQGNSSPMQTGKKKREGENYFTEGKQSCANEVGYKSSLVENMPFPRHWAVEACSKSYFRSVTSCTSQAFLQFPAAFTFVSLTSVIVSRLLLMLPLPRFDILALRFCREHCSSVDRTSGG